MHGSLGFQSTLEEQVVTMQLIRLISYLQKEWKTLTKPAQPCFTSSTQPVKKKKIQMFHYLFL